MGDTQFTPPKDFDEAYKNWRDALDLANDMSEGGYARLWGALHILLRDTEYLANYAPGRDVPIMQEVRRQ